MGRRKNTLRRKSMRGRNTLRRKYNRKKRKSKKRKVNNQSAGVRPPARFERAQSIAKDEERQILDINTLVSTGYPELARKTGKFIILNKNPNELRFIDSSLLLGEDNPLGHVSMLDQDDFDTYYKFDNLRDPSAESVDPNDIVMMAGWIKFSHDGKIEKWNAHSGHYHPEDKDIEYTIDTTPMPREKNTPAYAPILF
jgi:hypothetical protein